MNKEESANSIRKNANEVHEVNCFRKEGNFFRTLVNLFREAILRKCTFEVEVFLGRSLGHLSVISRCSLGGIRQGIRKGKETTILIKRTFSVWEFFRGFLVHLWFILGL